jgi:hypothetical protein
MNLSVVDAREYRAAAKKERLWKRVHIVIFIAELVLGVLFVAGIIL